MPESTRTVSVRLPYLDEHIPRDRRFPDGIGLPVRINYDGEPIGRVIGWDDKGDGTAVAELELPASLIEAMAADMCVGIDGYAACQLPGEDGAESVVVDSIGCITQLGVWRKGERGVSLYGDQIPAAPHA